MNETVKLIECPRDAMQGIEAFIPTSTKVDYINSLLRVGFNTIDFGSFVSPKAIPQMKDTAEVLDQLEPSESKLLAIVANERGALQAVEFERIDYLGYPFSVSEEFQKRNTNASIEDSMHRAEAIQNLCVKHNKKAVFYLSMAFGNPYGEKWHPDLVTAWCERLHKELGVDILALSDTIGSSTPETINELFSTVLAELPKAEIGAHLHTTPDRWEEKVAAAYSAGCRRFDGALKGYGGCPMAADVLTGNMPTEQMVRWFKDRNMATGLDDDAFQAALVKSATVFSH